MKAHSGGEPVRMRAARMPSLTKRAASAPTIDTLRGKRSAIIPPTSKRATRGTASAART
jgi:hypothetical protein